MILGQLIEEFRNLKLAHVDSIKRRAAMVVCGPSVMRVYKPKTRRDLIEALIGLKICKLKTINKEENFRLWFEDSLRIIVGAIKKKNKTNGRLGRGLHWGHASKVLALYIREIVLNTHYFPRSVVARLRFFLYVPLDRIILYRLKQLGLRNVVSAINQIDKRIFYSLQEVLHRCAAAVSAPRILFDDNWASPR